LTNLSIVIPVYNEELNLNLFFERLGKILTLLDSKELSYEVIVNDNDSNDNSWELIRQASLKYNFIAHRFARNYGFQTSLMFGLKKSKGDKVIVLQSDLQDPPEEILRLVEEHERTNCPVILAVPNKRTDKFTIRIMRKIFYKVLELVSDYKVVRNIQDFYLITRPVVNEIIQSPVFHQFIRTRIIENYSKNLSIIRYEKGIRVNGQSSFNFSRLYSLAMDAFLLQSSKFLRIITIVSLVIFILGLMIIFLVTTGFILGFKFPVSGYTSILFLLILNLSAVTLGGALILEYLKRQHKINFHPDFVCLTDEVQS
jgi:glycosyltransferase involved in cell wall biosynthesis